MDRGGSFHMYPDVGGPFQSLVEVEDAIDQHLLALQIPEMGEEELDRHPIMERAIRRAMYWPDGTRKHSRSAANGDFGKNMCDLVQALVEKYNDDHNLFGDFAYELKEYGNTYKDERWYYHLNFTAKVKGADVFDSGMDDLNTLLKYRTCKEKKIFVVSCCCIIKPNANGHCYGCTNNGSDGMKHPNNADAYTGGHLDGYLPFGLGDSAFSDYDDLDPEAEEAMLRSMYEVISTHLVQYITTCMHHACNTEEEAGAEDKVSVV